MDNACTIFSLAKAKVLLPPLSHSSPPTEVSPRAPCLKEVENLHWLPIVLQQKTVRKMHTSRSTTCRYSRCVNCVCEHVYICIVYMSACEQCCRLCNNSILFKVYNEKFRCATYITVFDGICQFLITLR